MNVIRGILFIILVGASDIAFYFWGRRDGFDSFQQLAIEYILEKIKERKDSNV